MESTFIKSVNMAEFTGLEAEYHAAKDHLSASAMKRLKISPLHYKEEAEQTETEALLFGSAYHCFILEPERFEKEYFIFDDSVICDILIGEGSKSPRATNRYKDWAAAQLMEIGDRQTISKADAEKLKAMKARLMKHHQVRMLLEGGRNEIGFTGEIETEAGAIKVKIKPDHLNDKKKIIVDLKTCIDASLDGFTRHAADLDYHIQAAFYADLMELITGDNRPWDFFFIAQEKKAPYAFNIFEASPQFISQGRYEYEHLCGLYKQCLDNDKWPGYQVWCESRYGVLDLSLPPYSIKKLDYFNHQ